MSYERVSETPYELERTWGGWSAVWVLVVGVLGVAAGMGYGLMELRNDGDPGFPVALGTLMGGMAASTGAFLLGMTHANRPVLIAQPSRLVVEELGGRGVLLRAGRRSFRGSEVTSVWVESVPAGEDQVRWLVAIVLEANVIELMQDEEHEATAIAAELSERLGLGGAVQSRTRGLFDAPIALPLVILLAAVGADAWAMMSVITTELTPETIGRVTGYVLLITLGTYVATLLGLRATRAETLRSLYGLQLATRGQVDSPLRFTPVARKSSSPKGPRHPKTTPRKPKTTPRRPKND